MHGRTEPNYRKVSILNYLINLLLLPNINKKFTPRVFFGKALKKSCFGYFLNKHPLKIIYLRQKSFPYCLVDFQMIFSLYFDGFLIRFGPKIKTSNIRSIFTKNNILNEKVTLFNCS